jgi:hypothetical protein
MKMTTLRLALVLTLPLAMGLAACSGDSRSSVSPSSVGSGDQAAIAPGTVAPAKKGGGDVDLPFEVEGVISNIAGTCLTGLTLTITGQRSVTTNANTVFKDIACNQLQVGDAIEAKGVNPGPGALLAVILELGGVEIRGIISGISLAATCPNRTMTVGVTPVHTVGGLTRPTLFEDVTCATLANGQFVEVKGEFTGNPAFLRARFIELKN